MAVSFDTIKAGDVLYRTERQKMGNTTMSRTVVRKCRVLAVDGEHYRATVNSGSREIVVTSGWFRSWRRSPPEWNRTGLGEQTCAICYARKDAGHYQTCEHPKSVAARKKAAKAGGA